MEISEAAELARHHMDANGLHDWKLEWDQSKNRFGVCRNSSKTISLSIILVSLNPVHEVLDTIMHEIAHALCPPREGHGMIWARTAQRLGAKPVRCYGGEVVTPPRRRHFFWIRKCPRCLRSNQVERKSTRACCGTCFKETGNYYKFEYTYNN